MRNWLEENPNGLKNTFEKYFKMFLVDVRKASTALHGLYCIYSDLYVDIQGLCHCSSTCYIINSLTKGMKRNKIFSKQLSKIKRNKMHTD